MKTIALVATAILFAAPIAATAQVWTPAQEGRLSKTYDQCIDAAAGVMPEMVQCTMAEYDIQDAKLNQAYRMVMTRSPGARRTALRASQRGWIRTRDAACQRVYDEAGGGQASDSEQPSCLLHRTIERTMWLERYR